MGRSCDSSGQQSTSSHRTRSASDPKSTLDSTNPLRPHSDDQTHVRALVNGSRWVPTHSEPPPSSRAAGTCSHAGWEPSELEKPSLSCTEVHTSNGVLPPSIFGPKKKFRPVVQRPAPRDTCLHSALMEAIHSAGGRDRLRKVSTAGTHLQEHTFPPARFSALDTDLRWHWRREGARIGMRVDAPASLHWESCPRACGEELWPLQGQAWQGLGLLCSTVEPDCPGNGVASKQSLPGLGHGEMGVGHA